MSLMVICVFALSLYEFVMLSGRELKRIVTGIKKEDLFWSSLWCPEQAWAEGDGECRQPITQKDCYGHKKRRPFWSSFFGARNRT